MASVLNRRHVSDTGQAVKYTPCLKNESTAVNDVENGDDVIDEISVVCHDGSVRDDTGSPLHDNASRTGSGSCLRVGQDEETCVERSAPNGPLRNSPGTSGTDSHMLSAANTNSDRTKLIGKRLSSTGGDGRLSMSPPGCPSRVIEQKRNSVFDRVSNKIERVTSSNNGAKRQYTRKNTAYVNRAHTIEPVTPKELRKQRRSEIDQMFGKGRKSCADTSTIDSSRGSCRWTFVFDPAGRLSYWWSMVVSAAFIYNFWVLIFRFAFSEIDASTMHTWFIFDYTADFIYLCDIAFRFRSGYLMDGVLQTDSTKLRIHYMNSMTFYVDCLCLLPLDFLYLSIGFRSIFRCFRLVKIYRFWAFLDRTERHTNYPNLIRTVTLLHYLLAIYHWNACLIYTVVRSERNTRWKFPTDSDDVLAMYLHSLYWSTLTLTTIGEMPLPESKGEYAFVIFQFIFALLLFSSVLGHVANIVTAIGAARRKFQAQLDTIKTYMRLRHVPAQLNNRVIRWFDYLWLSKKSLNEEKTLNLLPDKLKAEIALHVHLDTLKRVEIFQNTEAGFLCELVLRLKPVLFSPGDYICRKGEVGKDMYIVSRGRLQVVTDNGRTTLALLKAGSYFGEISILNMGSAGNRRTASVRSIGYSDLFCLSKEALWEVLKDYPTARVRLESIAVKRLQRYKKAPMEQAALARCRSTPGLVESEGKTPVDSVKDNYHNTLPPTLGHGGQPDTNDGSTNDSERMSGYDASTVRPCGGMSRSHEVMTLGEVTSMTVSSAGSGDVAQGKNESVAGTRSPSHSPYVTMNSQPAEPGAPLYTTTSGSGVETFHPAMAGVGLPANVVLPQQLQTLPPGGSYCAISHCNSAAAFPISPYANVFAPTFLAAAPTPEHSPSARSLPPVTFSLDPPTPLMPQSLGGANSASFVSQSRDPTSEILLQEISRLRERLHSMETENAAMALKLNHQQWEVDHRLSEIEMQICGSDSAGSGSDDRSSIVPNKESVI